MIGNNKYIANIISKMEENPVKDEYSNQRILDIYWMYIKHLMKYTEETAINIPYVGNFVFHNSGGKGVMRYFVKRLRALKEREKLEELGEGNQSYKDDITKQAKATWKQLKTKGEVFRIRTEAWKKKKLNKGILDNKVDIVE